MRTLRAWRALARVERRQLRRHPWRSLLVLLLVAVPVGAIVAGATLSRMTEPTPLERRIHAMGRADLRVDAVDGWAGGEPVRGILPDGATLVRLFAGLEQVGVPGRRLRARLHAIEPAALDDAAAGGLAAGMLRIVAGRAPANAGEVALSPALLDGLERALGDTVTLAYGTRRTIVGVVLDPEDLELPLVLRAPARVEHPGEHALLVDLPDGEDRAAVAALREAGFTVRTRADAEVGDGAMTFFVFALGAIGLFEAALVISAAFAVGLRRRQREIGLLGSTGATVAGVTVSLVTSAAGLALIGSVAGAAVGAAVVAALTPWLDGWTNRLNGAFEVAPGHLVGAIVLGVAAAVLAAVLPARSAAGLSVRDALAGRRPAARRSRSWLILGASMVMLGLVLLALAHGGRGLALMGVVVGPILGLLGFGACSPWLLDSLSRRAARLPLAWRLAVRDAGRFRERNGAVVTAVLAGMSMSVTVAVMVGSLEAAIDAFPTHLRDDQLLVEGPGAEETARGIALELSALAVAPLRAAYTHGEPVRARLGGGAVAMRGEWIAVGDADLARALGAEEGLDALSAGRLLSLDPPGDVDGIELTAWVDGSPIESPAVEPVATPRAIREPAYVLGVDGAAAIGLVTGPPPNRSMVPWLVRLDGPVTIARLDLARSIAAESVNTSVDAELLRGSPFRAFYHVVLLVCGLTGLLIVVIATALSAAESAADERILHTVGAAPRLLRSHLAARAGYLAWLGCVLAVPVGLISAAALFEAVNFPLPFVVPWGSAAIIVVGLPVLVFVATWCFGGGRQRRRVAASMVLPLVMVLSGVSPGAGTYAGSTGGSVMSPVVAPYVSVMASPPASTASPAAPLVYPQPFTAEAFDGSPLDGELFRIRVLEERNQPRGPMLELAFVRYRTTHPNPGPPIFFLAGGPGGSGIEGAAIVATHPQIRLLEHADVIGLDQRGTGLGIPNLATSEIVEKLPLDRPVTRADLIAAARAAAARTLDHWGRQGFRLSSYNTVESADDLEAVRRLLGLDAIVLYGSSYGSHLGFAYLRRHGEHVARAVLSRVEGPDHTWKLPGTVQRHLEQVEVLVAGDPSLGGDVADLSGTLNRLLRRLAEDPVTVGEPSLVLGPLDLQIAVARALDSVETIAALPASLHRFEQGDWSGLVETARENRRVELSAMPLMMDCASGATPERLQRIDRETRDGANLLGDAILAPLYPAVCDAAGSPDLGDTFRGPLRSDAPVLFVSGTLDVRTPPGNVDEIRYGFPAAVHVVIENAGHASRELMSRDYRDLLQAFLRGEPIEDCRITLPEPMFGPL